MAGYTTAMCGSAKAEMAQAMHCFTAPFVFTATLTSGATTLGSISSATGLVHGMPLSGTGVQANCFALNNAGTWLMSLAASAAGAQSLTGAGDAFWIALGIPSPSGTFGASTTNYSQLGADEVANGGGYLTGGQLLTVNITPANTAGNSFWQWTVNPSWTSATFSTRAALTYNKSNRAPTANRSISVHDFGGTQSVAGGTFTLLQPANGSTTSLLQIN